MSLSLYELMAEDHLIYARLEKNGEITTTITNENDETVYDETSHEAAWNSLVYFAQQVIDENKRINELKGVINNANTISIWNS